MLRTILAPLGAVGTAVVSSLCCTGPLAFTLLGIGGATFGTSLAAYRPYALVASALLLSIAYRLNYGKKNNHVVECKSCEPAAPNRIRSFNRIAFWVAVSFSVTFMLIPQILAWL